MATNTAVDLIYNYYLMTVFFNTPSYRYRIIILFNYYANIRLIRFFFILLSFIYTYLYTLFIACQLSAVYITRKYYIKKKYKLLFMYLIN